jgi:electron transfer flavoprotein alpha subunit
MEKILIFVETKGDEARKVSLELLSEGRKLEEGGRFSTEAVALGPVSDVAKDRILTYTGRLVNIIDSALGTYNAEGYAKALAAYATEVKACLILGGATRTARDFFPRAAVLLKAGIASDVTDACWFEDPMTFVRPIYGGKILAEVSFSSYPAFVTTRPNTFNLAAPGEAKGEFVEKEIGIAADGVRTSMLRVEEMARDSVDLTEADIIVAGGRGLQAAENFRLLDELAGVIGATVGASRPVVDAKWRDQEDQVGKSGKTVSPKLYIAAGISGAIHHTMGMDTSKVVVAINKDASAIIYDYADYGVVGDLLEVLPAMTKELKKRLNKQG